MGVVLLKNENAETVRLAVSDLEVSLILKRGIISACEVKLRIVILPAVDKDIPEGGIGHIHFIDDVFSKSRVIGVKHDACLGNNEPQLRLVVL